MTPKDLKNSILQLAIQGKLVEQRPEEGTAEALYQEIQKEKAALIKVGKIKKQKPLPEIKEEEKLFDIPEGWKWVRLNEIAISNLGKTLNKTTDNGDLCQYLCSINVYWDGINLDNVKEARFSDADKEKYKLEKGDLLICEGGDAGRCAIWNDDRKMYYQNALHRVRFYGSISAEYFRCIFELYKGTGIIKRHCKGETIQHLVQGELYSILFPLPPLAEQKRIVAKIEELLPLVERYEAAYNRLEKLNKCFPEDLKKSILQLAIQGKLVEQRAEEGTAEALYQEIQKEKAALIKAGKIKKQKPLPEIKEEEKPFDIPETWKWCRIGSIFSLQAGKNKTAKDIFDEKSKNHPYQCFGGNGIRGYVDESNWEGHFSIIGRQGALCGNINLAKGSFYATEHAVVVQHFNVTDVLWSAHFLTALNLNQYATATAQPGLAVSNINQVLIPLPPLAEQKRIVAKIEELLPLCEQLR